MNKILYNHTFNPQSNQNSERERTIRLSREPHKSLTPPCSLHAPSILPKHRNSGVSGLSVTLKLKERGMLCLKCLTGSKELSGRPLPLWRRKGLEPGSRHQRARPQRVESFQRVSGDCRVRRCAHCYSPLSSRQSGRRRHERAGIG